MCAPASDPVGLVCPSVDSLSLHGAVVCTVEVRSCDLRMGVFTDAKQSFS